MDIGCKIDLAFSDLGNYGHLSESAFRNAVKKVNGIIGDTLFNEKYGDLILGRESGFTVENGFRAYDYVKSLLNEVRREPDYQRCLEAYKDGDQRNLGELIPLVFATASPTPINRCSRRVFHGVSVDETTRPDEYADVVKEITESGLRASPHGRHHSMDENIRPIYFVNNSKDTHGAVFFSFDVPQRYVLFNPHFEAEKLIYMPSLDVSGAEVFIKSKDGISVGRHESFHPIDAVSFLREVKDELKKRRIRFEEAPLDRDF